jgi:hypothetical protein
VWPPRQAGAGAGGSAPARSRPDRAFLKASLEPADIPISANLSAEVSSMFFRAICCLGCVALGLWAARGDAIAQPIRVGESSFVSSGNATTRFPDVEFDSTNMVYLVVNGQFTVTGQFLDRNGARIGNSFTLIPSKSAITARVSYAPGPNLFLVTFIDEANPKNHVIGGRFLRFGAGGVPEFLSGEFVINASGIPKHFESAPSSAWSAQSGEFLVTWAEFAQAGGPDVKAQRLGADGSLRGGTISVSASSGWEGLPAVAYNSLQDEFAVAHMYEPPSGGQFARLVRVKAGSGEVLGGNNLYGSAGLNNYPEIAYDSRRNRYLVITWYFTSNADVWGMMADGNLNPASSLIPVAAEGWFEGGDGIGLAYNHSGDTYLAAFQGPSRDTLAAGVSGDGIPHLEFRAMVTGARNDIYQPQIAADAGQARWLIAASVDYNRVMGQIIETAGSGNPGDGGGGGGGGGGEPPPPSAHIDLTAQAAPNGSWFFAEGATEGGAGFDTYYLVENPHPQDVQVVAYFARDTDGYTVEKSFNVPAQTRYTVRLGDHVPAGAYGVVFQSRTPGADVFVERSVYWGSVWGEGGASAAGEHDLRMVWYFAEGTLKSNGYFDNHFLVFNPSNVHTANVLVTFYLQDGAGTVQRSYQLAPRTRLNLLANTVAELAQQDFATVIESDLPVVAERSMYWAAGTGGTSTMGAAAPSPVWYFAEGAAAPNFDTYLTILNPNATSTIVDVTYLGESGQIGGVRSYTVPARSRSTLWLTAELEGFVGAVGARVGTRDGTTGIVCERSTYWGNGQWVEGANALGVTRPAPVWHLPEGLTLAGFDTFVLIVNPNPDTVRVRVWPIHNDGGRPYPVDIDIEPHGRETIWVNHDWRFPQEHATAFSIHIETITPGPGVIAEHALYWRADGQHYWRGGSAAFGIPRDQ